MKKTLELCCSRMMIRKESLQTFKYNHHGQVTNDHPSPYNPVDTKNKPLFFFFFVFYAIDNRKTMKKIFTPLTVPIDLGGCWRLPGGILHAQPYQSPNRYPILIHS